MRILNIMQCTNLGGMEQASLRQMQGLIARGHQCNVVSVTPLGALTALLEKNSIPSIGLPFLGRFGWRSHLRLRDVVRKFDYDALLMTGPTISGILALGKPDRRPRVLAAHFHHTGVNPRWAWRILYRVALKRFGAITFPSEFIRREAEQILPAMAGKSKVVRNPFVIPPLQDTAVRAAARRTLGLPTDSVVIGNAGWLIPRKRFDVFLQVAKQVGERFPAAIFVIAGDGCDKAALLALAGTLGLTDRVRWLGWQTDLTSFYQAIDVLLFNSDWDAFPTTPLEAMSYGVPVVASAINSGIGEVIENGRSGYLAGTHDVSLLAEQVCGLLSDATVARRLGLSGRERVKEVCGFDMAVDAIEQLLTGIQR